MLVWPFWQEIPHIKKGMSPEFKGSSSCCGTNASNPNWWFLLDQQRELRSLKLSICLKLCMIPNWHLELHWGLLTQSWVPWQAYVHINNRSWWHNPFKKSSKTWSLLSGSNLLCFVSAQPEYLENLFYSEPSLIRGSKTSMVQLIFF